ncbi:MAG: phosphonate C-P lyase system protein PhnK [Deltaproteobacteria bacterium]|jgi:putative phosphonate transport system ATP-binding protein|nr:phosphonate C-P lyase system protein PhnK [Deltaproteobacteria bacterium]
MTNIQEQSPKTGQELSLQYESEKEPLLRAQGLTHYYGDKLGCREVSFEVYPGEILGLVGESGSGKTTVLKLISGQMRPYSGQVLYRDAHDQELDLHLLPEGHRRLLLRTELGFVHQNPKDGLNMAVSAGANIADRLLSGGARVYREVRNRALDWLERVEINTERLDDRPGQYSGGMLQRLQIARNLVTSPRLVFLDEPTGGLDVSVQAKLLDLIRNLTGSLKLAAVLVTHDLAVARLLSQRLLVMKEGRVVETGLTDRVLDDPQDPYTQLLVSSTLEA